MMLITAMSVSGGAYAGGYVTNTRPGFSMDNGRLHVDMEIVLDSLHLRGNEQVYITPVLEDGNGNASVLPSVVANGRNMHLAWERGTIRRDAGAGYTIYTELRRLNGKAQSVGYEAAVPVEPWMISDAAHMVLVTDSCGCGHRYGSRTGDIEPLGLNPWRCMQTVYVTPAVAESPVSVHEGRARVQFEVDRTELHAEPYVCRNGQRIDNRGQLKVVTDSVEYALSDPNVEIVTMNICGYASPESPYLHNEQLSTGRSRALSEYIARRYDLPQSVCTYSSVPENWQEFRDIVLRSDEINEDQRTALLGLIDRPAYGPSDYDAKERELKTSKQFASLYRSLILPKWFPQLRCTEFSITTRLKPLSDAELAKVIKNNPGLMSLNQMMRVARLYPEGSAGFNEAIDTALKYYPDDETANLNAAVAAAASDDFGRAAELLGRAGDSPEARTLRGVIAARDGDFAAARRYFESAQPLDAARHNLDCMTGL